MRCTNCGIPLKSTARFCPSCGTLAPLPGGPPVIQPPPGSGTLPPSGYGPPPTLPPPGYGPPGYGPAPTLPPGYQVPAAPAVEVGVAVKGVEGMTLEQLRVELDRGGKFVIYEYCISALVVTFKRSSPIYFVRADQSRVGRGAGYIALSLLLGWWGIPWGPIFTVAALATDFKGGRDVTPHVAPQLLAGGR